MTGGQPLIRVRHISGWPWMSIGIAALLLNLVGCGAQGPPQFGQAFGGVDYPCALGTAASKVELHCAAHVVLVNHGGEGIGHVTLEVPLKNAQGSSPASNPACGRSIPDMPSGGNIDLVCEFDLPAGDIVDGVPTVKTVDYVVATAQPSAGFDFSGAGTLLLAVAILMLAGAVLIGEVRRRAEATGESIGVEADEGGSRAQQASAETGDAARLPVDAEYDLPKLPR